MIDHPVSVGCPSDIRRSVLISAYARQLALDQEWNVSVVSFNVRQVEKDRRKIIGMRRMRVIGYRRSMQSLRYRVPLPLLPLPLLVAWLSGRTSVFGRRSFSVMRSTCCGLVTTYVGKASAIGQSTRQTQPFIPSGSIDE